MKLLTFIALIIIGTTLAGCESSRNGQYLIYKITAFEKPFINVYPNPDNDTLREALNQYLRGRKIALDFQDSYVLANGLLAKQDLLFEADTGANNYLAQLKKADARFKIYLREGEDELLIRVDCKLEPNAPILIPAQLGEALLNQGPLPRYASAVCHLRKVD